MQYYAEAEIVLELRQLTTYESEKVLLGLPEDYASKNILKAGAFLPYDNYYLSQNVRYALSTIPLGQIEKIDKLRKIQLNTVFYFSPVVAQIQEQIRELRFD